MRKPTQTPPRRGGAVRRPAAQPAAPTRKAAASRKATRTQAPTGAKRHRVGFKEGMRSWKRHHLAVARESYKRLLQKPIASLMTIAVLAIALALPGTLYVGLKNLQSFTQYLGGDPRLSLYLDMEISEAQADQFSRQLLLRDDVALVELISKEQAMLDFQRVSGLADVLDYLEFNPLPVVISIQPADVSAQGFVRLQQMLAQDERVDEAKLDMAWVERLVAFIDLAARAVQVLAIMLAAAVLLVVGNTIRMEIENRRDEIVVAKLVGATDAWVRRPFLYTGAWFGFLGGVLAWLLIQVSVWVLSPYINHLVELYDSVFEFAALGFGGSVVLLALGTLLGSLGAWVAVGRHLKEVQPQ